MTTYTLNSDSIYLKNFNVSPTTMLSEPKQIILDYNSLYDYTSILIKSTPGTNSLVPKNMVIEKNSVFNTSDTLYLANDVILAIANLTSIITGDILLNNIGYLSILCLAINTMITNSSTINDTVVFNNCDIQYVHDLIHKIINAIGIFQTEPNPPSVIQFWEWVIIYMVLNQVSPENYSNPANVTETISNITLVGDTDESITNEINYYVDKGDIKNVSTLLKQHPRLMAFHLTNNALNLSVSEQNILDALLIPNNNGVSVLGYLTGEAHSTASIIVDQFNENIVDLSDPDISSPHVSAIWIGGNKALECLKWSSNLGNLDLTCEEFTSNILVSVTNVGCNNIYVVYGQTLDSFVGNYDEYITHNSQPYNNKNPPTQVSCKYDPGNWNYDLVVDENVLCIPKDNTVVFTKLMNKPVNIWSFSSPINVV